MSKLLFGILCIVVIWLVQPGNPWGPAKTDETAVTVVTTPSSQLPQLTPGPLGDVPVPTDTPAPSPTPSATPVPSTTEKWVCGDIVAVQEYIDKFHRVYGDLAAQMWQYSAGCRKDDPRKAAKAVTGNGSSGGPTVNGDQGTDASFTLPTCYKGGNLFESVTATDKEVKDAKQAKAWLAKMANQGCTAQGEIKLPNINIGLIVGGGGGGLLVLFFVIAAYASARHYSVAKHPDENPLTGVIWAACVIGVVVVVGTAVSAFIASGKLIPVPVLIIGSIIIFVLVMVGSLTITTGRGTSQYKWADSNVAIATAKAYFWIEVVFVAAVFIITAVGP